MFGVHPWQGASRVCSSSQQVTAALGPVLPALLELLPKGSRSFLGIQPHITMAAPAPAPSQAGQVVFLC